MEPADSMAAGAAEPARRLSTHPTRARTEPHFAARVTVRDMALLLSAVVLAHFPLLLNDGLYWDDWLLFRQLQGHDWASVDSLVREAGITPFNAAFFDVFAYLPGGVFGFRLVVFVLIVAIAWLVYAIAVEAGLTRRASLLIALLTTVFPGFQDWVLLATAASVLDYAVFLVATFLLVRAERQGQAAAAATRAAAVVLFVLSFSFNSLLTLYFGSVVLLVMVMWRSGQINAVLRRWLYLTGLCLVPFVYWLVGQRLFSPSGLYAGYNGITARPVLIAKGYAEFLTNGIIAQSAQALTVASTPLGLSFLAVTTVAALGFSYRAFREPSLRPVLWISGLALGAIAIVLAILPYAAVEKFPSVHGWDTRQDLLIALPLAVVGVMAVEAIAASLKLVWIGSALVIVIGAALALAGLQDYAALQARWATDASVMQQLKHTDGSGRYAVYWVHDGVPGPEDFYRFYEWSAMFGDVYGGQTRVGLDTRAYDGGFLGESQFFNDRYDLSGFDPNGCQADLTIKPGANYKGRAQVAVTYVFYRLFEPGQLDAYLGDLVVVDLTMRGGCSS